MVLQRDSILLGVQSLKQVPTLEAYLDPSCKGEGPAKGLRWSNVGFRCL